MPGNMIRKYTKLPVDIWAVQWDGTNTEEVVGFMIEKADFSISLTLKTVTIHTLEDKMTAKVGDYIIKGIKNEFYPCDPDIFAQTYKLAE